MIDGSADMWPRILKVCCNDQSHASKLVDLETFDRRAGEWHAWPQRVRKRGGFIPGQPTERQAVESLDTDDRPIGNAPLYPDDGTPGALERIARRRFAIECPLCGKRVVARAEKLEPVLQEFCANTPEDMWLPLGWLAARLSSRR